MADNMGVNPYKPSPDFQEKAKKLIFNYVKENLDPGEYAMVADEEVAVFVVWSVKTLQNWKALISTSVPDGKYYEVTYDNVRGVIYLDVYQKVDHFEILEKIHEEP